MRKLIVIAVAGMVSWTPWLISGDAFRVPMQPVAIVDGSVVLRPFFVDPVTNPVEGPIRWKVGSTSAQSISVAQDLCAPEGIMRTGACDEEDRRFIYRTHFAGTTTTRLFDLGDARFLTTFDSGRGLGVVYERRGERWIQAREERPVRGPGQIVIGDKTKVGFPRDTRLRAERAMVNGAALGVTIPGRALVFRPKADAPLQVLDDPQSPKGGWELLSLDAAPTGSTTACLYAGAKSSVVWLVSLATGSVEKSWTLPDVKSPSGLPNVEWGSIVRTADGELVVFGRHLNRLPSGGGSRGELTVAILATDPPRTLLVNVDR